MKFEVNPVYRNLKNFIKSLPSSFEKEGEVIYKGRNELRLYNLDGMKVVVKRFKKPHIINRFVYGYFRPSKAERSYFYAFSLIEKSVNTPVPIGYLEEYKFGMRYSYYISSYSSFAREVREFANIQDVEANRSILEAFGLFTARLHNLNILHLDYSPGNILFSIMHGSPLFSLVDINRMKFIPVREEMGYHNLRRLWFPDEVTTIIARAYAKGRGFDEEKAVERIQAYKAKSMKKG